MTEQTNQLIRVAIVGPTGYTGQLLIELIARHPDAVVTYLASHRDELPDIRDEFPRLDHLVDDEVAMCRPIDAEAIAGEADVAFLALPHRAAMVYAPQLLDAGLRVIDLSADYRLDDAALYERVYEHAHEDPAHMDDAVYGLPELFRKQLADAQFVANPGCYPTAAALAVAPLLTHSLVANDRIIVNAASGVTGAGRKPGPALHFPEAAESFAAYGVIGGHRHQPEIGQTLSRVAGHEVDVLFVPHLLPIRQGILETVYLTAATSDVTEDDLFDAFDRLYEDELFVRVKRTLPRIRDVVDTNFCDVTVRLVEPTHDDDLATVVVFAAIDNMVKGASGQAVQNMNAIFDLPESAGLL